MEPEPSRGPAAGRSLRVQVEGAESAPPALEGERGLAIPDPQQLDERLAEAEGVDQLSGLSSLAALYLEAGKRVDLAREELVRLATYRIKVERKFGVELVHHVEENSDRSRSQNGTWLPQGLPTGLTKQDANRLRELGVIPEAEFAAYLEQQRQKDRLPTAGGLRTFARKPKPNASPGSSGRRRRSAPLGGCMELAAACDAASRLLGDIDLLIGDAGVAASKRANPRTVKRGQLHGRVLVTECPEPASWIPRLAALRLASAVDQVVAIVDVESGADWFQSLAQSDWHCCFLKGPAQVMAAYHGPRAEAFFAAFQPLGVVVHVHAV